MNVCVCVRLPVEQPLAASCLDAHSATVRKRYNMAWWLNGRVRKIRVTWHTCCYSAHGDEDNRYRQLALKSWLNHIDYLDPRAIQTLRNASHVFKGRRRRSIQCLSLQHLLSKSTWAKMQMCHHVPPPLSVVLGQVLKVCASIDTYWLGLPCIATNLYSLWFTAGKELRCIPKIRRTIKLCLYMSKITTPVITYTIKRQHESNHVNRFMYVDWYLNLDLPKVDW